MITTLNKINEHQLELAEWDKLLRYLGKTEPDDEPLSLLTILDSNGFKVAFWCTRTVEGYDKELRLFTIWCARQVQHLLPYPEYVQALDVSERYANGLATKHELSDARSPLYSFITADYHPDYTSDVARAKWYAAWNATAAACDASNRYMENDLYSHREAERILQHAVYAAWYEALANPTATNTSAMYDTEKAQEAKFREMLKEIEK